MTPSSQGRGIAGTTGRCGSHPARCNAGRASRSTTVKFTMTLNANAATALGIEVPSSILVRADEVIE
jgi:ABC-type uncharacterized transport system substrate-binding protein